MELKLESSMKHKIIESAKCVFSALSSLDEREQIETINAGGGSFSIPIA